MQGNQPQGPIKQEAKLRRHSQNVIGIRLPYLQAVLKAVTPRLLSNLSITLYKHYLYLALLPHYKVNTYLELIITF